MFAFAINVPHPFEVLSGAIIWYYVIALMPTVLTILQKQDLTLKQTFCVHFVSPRTINQNVLTVNSCFLCFLQALF